MRSVGRTRPAGKAKEKVVEAMENVEDQEGQRGRVAPNMGAGGSHPKAMSVPERRERHKG